MVNLFHQLLTKRYYCPSILYLKIIQYILRKINYIKMNKSIIIVGGGTAGITIAAQLVKLKNNLAITLIEPSSYHYYQPLYTLVGAGADKVEKTRRLTKKFIPKGVNWLQTKVQKLQPAENIVILENGESLNYDFLVVCPGLQIDWEAIKGLKETMGKNGVCSVYGYEESAQTWQTLNEFKGGTAIFTAPNTPVKCGGAPQKITYLTDALLRKKRIRQESKVTFATGARKLFAVKGFAETLENLVQERNIKTLFNHELIRVDGGKDSNF